LNLGVRLLTGFSIGGFVLWGLLWAPVTVFSIGACAFSALALYELLTILMKKGAQVYRFFGVAMGAIIPWVVHCQMGRTHAGEVLFIVLSCFSLFLIQFMGEENPRALEGIALTFFGIMYVGWFLSFIIKIRYLADGGWWIFYLLAVTKSADIGAYAAGSLWGKHTLIAHISPKKTVEGTLGGFAASVLVSLLFVGKLPASFSAVHHVNAGITIAAVAHIGDLAESLIKRYAGVKDSGVILPGFGGFLDIMDSVLFTVPLFYFYLEAVL